LSRSRHAIFESPTLARLLLKNGFAASPKLIWINWYPMRRAILPLKNAGFCGESLMKSLPIAALLLAAMTATSLAQSAAEHEQHHPQQQDAVPAPTQPAPPASQFGMGMMSGGGMVNMMGNNMMDMMQMMGMMHTGGMGGMAMIDHVEGRIAFLRTELKITDAQNAAWNTFADALRANAKSVAEVRASMMMPQQGAASQTLVDRLSVREKWLAARLEGTRAIKSALTNLAGTFSDEQKKTADELLAQHMGMMTMMSGMQPGQMGPGQMMPGTTTPSR
jgi:hypothetical protein